MSSRTTAVACLTCRRVKTRCTIDEGDERCNRCKRMGKDCIFEAHRRGNWRRNHVVPPRPQETVDSGGNLQASIVNNIDTFIPSTFPAVAEPRRVESCSPFPADFNNGELLDEYSAPVSFQLGASQDSSSLQESNLASFAGASSNQDRQFLNPAPSSGLSSNRQIYNVGMAGLNTTVLPDDDPVEKKILNLPAAQHLFDGFFKYFNYMVGILDPDLYTFHYTRRASPLLLTVILCTSSRVFRPELHRSLCKHGEMLLGQALLSCDPVVENIWAIVCLYHWKDVGDKRGYSLIGFAIRIATSSKWYKDVQEFLEGTIQAQTFDETELQVRQRRDKVRVWLILGNLDRYSSYFSDRPQFATPNLGAAALRSWVSLEKFSFELADARGAAGIELHRATKAVCEYILREKDTKSGASQQQLTIGTPMNELEILQTLVDIMNADLTAWGGHWGPIFAKYPQTKPCLEPLIYRYEEHVRLQFNSIHLQHMLASNQYCITDAPALAAVEICFSSAVAVLQHTLTVSRMGVLYFLWDTAHLMTAHSAIMLLKILRLVDRASNEDAMNALHLLAELTTLYVEASESQTSPQQNVTQPGQPTRSVARSSLDAQARLFRGIMDRIEVDVFGSHYDLYDPATEELLPGETMLWSNRQRYFAPDSDHFARGSTFAQERAISVAQFFDDMGKSLDLSFNFLDPGFIEALQLLQDRSPRSSDE